MEPELIGPLPALLADKSKQAMKNTKTVIVYFDKDQALAPIIEIVCQMEYHESPVVTLEPTETQFNENILIVDTSYNINLCLNIMMKLFEDDHYPQKLLWVLVPCNWKNRIGTENEGRTDITLAEFTALIRPEIIYVQRPSTFTQAVQNYMTIAEGSFISHGLKLREMSCEV